MRLHVAFSTDIMLIIRCNPTVLTSVSVSGTVTSDIARSWMIMKAYDLYAWNLCKLQLNYPAFQEVPCSCGVMTWL